MFQTKKYTKNELNDKLSSIQKNDKHITEKYNIILDEKNCDKVSNGVGASFEYILFKILILLKF